VNVKSGSVPVANGVPSLSTLHAKLAVVASVTVLCRVTAVPSGPVKLVASIVAVSAGVSRHSISSSRSWRARLRVERLGRSTRGGETVGTPCGLLFQDAGSRRRIVVTGCAWDTGGDPPTRRCEFLPPHFRATHRRVKSRVQTNCRIHSAAESALRL